MSQREQLLDVVERDLFGDLKDFALLQRAMIDLHGVLLARECVEINLVNERIKTLLDAISVRAKRRSKVLGAFQLGADSSAMHALIGYFTRDRQADLQNAWKTLIESAGHCRALNERNGKLLAMHSDILQQLLSTDSGQIYSPSI
ncbi:flagellar export chaperone FlgN [Pseudomonas chlororaphis subsp. aurantiaca]|uniref:flagellar export chaperone FlgN n=1 Tax=Pseudomonas chlororaphis TaxID=587753 RepID=UPI0027DC0A16|nr:flagellar export chaperone FlgN [Pseudomonas chlororaphis]WMI97618.1 flagellar export chaperone FlgN [Pseudomonas chlororaphis subsp. aurantiaca]